MSVIIEKPAVGVGAAAFPPGCASKQITERTTYSSHDHHAMTFQAWQHKQCAAGAVRAWEEGRSSREQKLPTSYMCLRGEAMDGPEKDYKCNKYLRFQGSFLLLACAHHSTQSEVRDKQISHNLKTY